MSNQFHEFGPFRIDSAARVLWRGGERVPVTDKEFDTLFALVRRAGAVLDKDALLKEVWPDKPFIAENNLNQRIRGLRVKLGKDPAGEDYIRTIAGRGYFIAVPVVVREAPYQEAPQPEPDAELAVTAPEPPPIHAAEPRKPNRRIAIVAALLAGVAAILAFRSFHAKAVASIPQASRTAGRLLSRATSEGRTPIYCDTRQIATTMLPTPDGRKLYLFEQKAKSVTVLNTATLAISRTLSFPSNIVRAAFAPDGKRIYAGSSVDGLYSIDTSTDQVSDTGIRTGGPVQDLVVTPDGKRVFLALGSQGLKEADLATGDIRAVSEHISPQFLALDPVTHHLFVSYQGGGPGGSWGHDALVIRDIDSGQMLSTITGLPRVGGPVYFRPSGDLALLDEWDACSTPSYDHIGCPSVPSQLYHLLWTREHNRTEALTTPRGTMDGAFSPDGTRYVFGGPDVSVFDMARRKIVERLRYGQARLDAAAFTPRGDRLFVALGGKPGLLVFDAEQGECSAPELGLANLYTGDGTPDDAVAAGTATSEDEIQFAPGAVGQAFRFTGRPRGYIKIPHAEACLMCVGEWTVSLLVKFASLGGEATILSRRKSSDDRGYRWFRSSDNKIVFQFEDGRSTGRRFEGTTPITAGHWYRLDLVSDGKSIAFFTDGNKEGNLPLQEWSLWGIAYAGGSPEGHPLDGAIDELAFYSRALSAREIRAAHESRLRHGCGTPVK
jgi:DNA-binding winged helix-turn-helix (wHTH) protein